MSEPTHEPATPPPLLSVVRGQPTDEELAALVIVLQRRGGGSPAASQTPISGWSAYWRGVQAPLAPGPGAWRASGRRT